jgi:uncharacterized protein YyaL (SSP411 family)
MHKPNKLINEKSPYLLQHAYNPVEWNPWGEEAFEKARNEDKPIFLSIGYSTCYWCHVMEREVFENEQIAKEMNRIFVNIKVDREERPDVDRVYMSALQSMTGSGGWPMSMFLTTELKPFYGGTYIPPASKYGMGGFEELILQLEEEWKTRRDEINKAGTNIIDHIKEASSNEKTGTELTKEMLLKGAQQFKNGFDEDYGGFGSAPARSAGGPKFPRPVGINFLLRMYDRYDDQESLKMVIRTLLQMARGGVYDHLGGGFHRYSVDRYWRVPHFEKMLYDQAQLAVSYIEAYQVTKDEYFAEIAKDILKYVSRKLTSPEGGFYSAEDAESLPAPRLRQAGSLDANEPDVKEEGAVYVWEYKEIEKILGEDAEIFCYYFGITADGNAPDGSDPHSVFVDKNILYLAHSISETANKFDKPTNAVNEIIEEDKKILFQHREKRPQAHLDDKVLVSWNGLMISAFAKAYQVFGDESYLHKAKDSTDFILTKMFNENNNSLMHRYRDGESRFDGNLEDYAFFIQGLIDLYEASFEFKYLETAVILSGKMITDFYDNDEGGFYDTSGIDKSILVRTKEDYDSAEPTGNSIAILNLLRLSEITDNKSWHEKAYNSILLFSKKIEAQPYAMPQMLVALDFALNKPKQIVISGDKKSNEAQNLMREVYSRFIPCKVLIHIDEESTSEILKPWFIYKSAKPTAYVCENYTCRLPVNNVNDLAKLLDK